MKKIRLLQYTLVAVFALTSLQAYAVKMHTTECDNGKTVELADSEYTPAAAALACLKAKTNPAADTGVQLKRERLSATKSRKAFKTFKASVLKKRVAEQTNSTPSNVDHSDIILMLQGCECISPSCVAYSCPADVDVP